MSMESKDKHEGLAELHKNKHGLYTVAGLVVGAIAGLLLRDDLLFGLVMGTVYISGLGAGRKTITAINANAPAEHIMPAKVIGTVIAAIITGIIATVFIAIIRGLVGDESMAVIPEDNVIIQIVKYFFDYGAAAAVGIGLLVGAWGLGAEEE